MFCVYCVGKTDVRRDAVAENWTALREGLSVDEVSKLLGLPDGLKAVVVKDIAWCQHNGVARYDLCRDVISESYYLRFEYGDGHPPSSAGDLKLTVWKRLD